MATLHDDADMAAQLERTLLGAYCGSADLGEAISTSARVAPGDYSQWYVEWAHTAEVALGATEAAAATTTAAPATKPWIHQPSNFLPRCTATYQVLPPITPATIAITENSIGRNRV